MTAVAEKACDPATAKLGFVGLGTIGFPIRRNFAASGVEVVAYDAAPRPGRMAALEAAGAVVGEGLALGDGAVAAPQAARLPPRDEAARRDDPLT